MGNNAKRRPSELLRQIDKRKPPKKSGANQSEKQRIKRILKEASKSQVKPRRKW